MKGVKHDRAGPLPAAGAEEVLARRYYLQRIPSVALMVIATPFSITCSFVVGFVPYNMYISCSSNLLVYKYTRL